MSDLMLGVDKPLDYRGRFGRLSYLAWALMLCLVFTVVAVVIGFIAGFLGGMQGSSAGIIVGAVLGIPALIALCYFISIIMIRRLHDLNLSGWTSLILFVPIVGFFFSLFMLFWKGTTGDNRFGPQRETLGWEKVLGWIYVALMLIGIAGMVALWPTYKQMMMAAMSSDTAALSMDPAAMEEAMKNMDPAAHQAAMEEAMKNMDPAMLEQMENDPEMQKAMEDMQQAMSEESATPAPENTAVEETKTK